jgi:hypothetical protein
MMPYPQVRKLFVRANDWSSLQDEAAKVVPLRQRLGETPQLTALVGLAETMTESATG